MGKKWKRLLIARRAAAAESSAATQTAVVNEPAEAPVAEVASSSEVPAPKRATRPRRKKSIK